MKAVLAPALRKIAPSSIWFGPPKGFYTEPKDYFFSTENAADRYHKIYPAEVYKNELPEKPDQSIHATFKRHISFTVPEQYILELKHGRVLGVNCCIIAENDMLIGNVSREFRVNGNYARMSVFRALKLPRLQSLDKVVGVVGYAGGHYNYFHWMYDVLPRIGLLEKTGWLKQCDHIVINAFKLPFHEETIRMMGLPLEKFIFSSKKLHLRAKKLIVPSIPETGDFSPAWAIGYLRSKLVFKALSVGPDERKVYLSRKGALTRKITNEEAVTAHLIEEGFQVYRPENLSLEKQAELFYHASVIVAPHGAGQANLIFCRPGTKVIEIFSPEWVNCCYWSLSNRLSLNYNYVMGKIEGGNGKTLRDADFTVDIDELKGLISGSAGIIQSIRLHDE